jgi:hypothetical protein
VVIFWKTLIQSTHIFKHPKNLAICLKVVALAATSVSSTLASQQQRCVLQVNG